MSTDTAGRATVGAAWTDHALEHWRNSHEPRNDVPERDPEQAYTEAVDVDYPAADAGAWGRYHAAGDCVLIVTREPDDRGQLTKLVVTVIDLTDRPAWEQAYVRCQARYGGG